MIQICRYSPDQKEVWDAFVAASKNGTFLFRRDYMDYHADRFSDHSLLFRDERGRIVALLPGNEVTGDGTAAYHSHQGLTYGGFILSPRSRAEEVLALFDTLLPYLREQGFSSLHYKQVPTIYHLCPAQEEDYALWRHGAVVEGCNISCAVPLHDTLSIPAEATRRRGARRAAELGWRVVDDAPLSAFWPIMVENLRRRYDASPVHTLSEMQLLQSRFPQEIRCYVVTHTVGGEEVAEAGAVVYVTRQVVHVQYGHTSLAGREARALDLLYLTLIERYAQQADIRYFDFGTSNEQGGRYLNENLIAQKEGFGGRGVAYRTYRIDL